MDRKSDSNDNSLFSTALGKIFDPKLPLQECDQYMDSIICAKHVSTHDFWTLFLYCKKQRSNLFDYLFTIMVDILLNNIKENNQNTISDLAKVIYYCINFRQPDLALRLLSHQLIHPLHEYPLLEYQSVSLFHMALQSSCTSVIKWMLTHYNDFNHYRLRNDEIDHVIRGMYLPMIRILVSNNILHISMCSSIMQQAIRYTHLPIVHYLLDEKMDPNIKTTDTLFSHPLSLVLRSNSIDMADLLLHYGSSPFKMKAKDQKLFFKQVMPYVTAKHWTHLALQCYERDQSLLLKDGTPSSLYYWTQQLHFDPHLICCVTQFICFSQV